MSWVTLANNIDLRERAKNRTKIRAIFQVSSAVPVIVSNEVDRPAIFGSYGGWFTRSGTPVSYPSAYSKKGWSNLVYQTSTKHILVPISFADKV
jgi:hypothetical protein